MKSSVNYQEVLTPTIGVACIARQTFVVEYAQKIANRALAVLCESGLSIVGDARLLMDANDAREAGQAFQGQPLDALVLLCASFGDASVAVELASHVDAPICLWAVREPGKVGDRLWLNSLCGANISSHALQRVGHQTTYIYGDPGEEGLLRPLIALARASATARRLRHSRVGLVGQVPTGFYGCQYDELDLAETIGTTVAQIDLAALLANAAHAPQEPVEAVISATAQRSPSLNVLNSTDVQHFGQAYVVLKEAIQAQHLDGLAVRCWPEFPQQFGLMPCATLGKLADDGFMCACETDMHGMVTMLALRWLTNTPPWLADVVALDQEANTVSLWHCGNASSCLAAEDDPITLTPHCNRKVGVAGNFALGAGPATVTRLGVGRQGYRLFFIEGEVLEAPSNRFQGNTAAFRPRSSAHQLLDTIMLNGWEHHIVLTMGHVAPELAALARLWNIEAVALS